MSVTDGGIAATLNLLPLRSLCAFAARCAERVESTTADLPDPQRASIRASIVSAHAYAAGTSPLVVWDADLAVNAMAEHHAANGEDRAGARAATHAAVAARWASFNTPTIGAKHHRARVPAQALAAHREMLATTSDAAAQKGLHDAAAADVAKLLAIHSSGAWDLGPAVDATEAGPLGVSGASGPSSGSGGAGAAQ